MQKPEVTMKKHLCLLAAMLLVSQGCLAGEAKTIDEVSDDGETITMTDGTVYQVDDTVETSTWQSTDDVVVTDDDTLVNTSDGSQTDATQIN